MSKSEMQTGEETTARNRYEWALWVSLGIMLLASLPYILGYGIAPPGYKYLGFTYIVDDCCVYLSWMRQAADGHFFLRNLFTTEPQNANGFNLLFLLLGNLARITHLSLTAVFHLSRVAFGAALLMAVYLFAGIWLKDERSRRVALLVTGLASGLGWMLPSGTIPNSSVDMWQPEAITFLSVYLSPLYSFPTLLMLSSIYFLYRFAETRVWKYACFAGLALLVLANVHTYDIITVAIIWALYSLYKLIRKPHDPYPIYGGLIAALIAMPLAAYQFHFYHTEPIFRMRAAVPTISPAFVWYLLGYGLLIPLAAVGVWKSRRNRQDISLLVCWVVAGFAAAYLPVGFQRKLVMGSHIPLSLLAAIGLIALADHFRPRARGVLIGAMVVFMVASNLVFMWSDCTALMSNESGTVAHVPLISDKELAALDYLREHTGPKDIILATPGTAALVPGYTGRTVYAGHWGETVYYKWKLAQLIGFYLPGGSNAERLSFLRKHKITYVVGYHSMGEAKTDMEDFRAKPVPFLQPMFETDEISIYRVKDAELLHARP